MVIPVGGKMFFIPLTRAELSLIASDDSKIPTKAGAIIAYNLLKGKVKA